jgi:putative hemolysin
MIAGVMRLGDRPVRAVMTPMTSVLVLSVEDGSAGLRRKILESPHSRIPVHGGDPDNLIGIVQIKEIADALLQRKKFDLAALVRTVPVIPESMPALEAMELFRGSSIHLAFVQDEYGRTLGIVTAADLLEAIAGTFEAGGEGEDGAVEREDGSWLLPGGMAVDEMAELIGFTLPPKRRYETVAGLLLDQLKHLPSLGQSVTVGQWRFEVIDLDGRRVDKVLASRVAGTRRKVSTRSRN